MFKRFNFQELTLTRLSSAVHRRFQEFPHILTWHLTSTQNKQWLQAYKDIHKGKRCFIIANGPSLKKTDLTLLQGEFTFGMNRIYLLFDEIGYKPTYFVCINEIVLEEFGNDIKRLSMPKFLNWNRRALFQNDDANTLFLRSSLSLADQFGYDPSKVFYSGGTVTYTTLQLAYYMGFQEVILIGLDHSYVEKGTPNKLEVRSEEEDQSHFHPNYFPKGVRWQLPDLLRSEIAYQLARDVYEQDGRKIVDATIGGKCAIFEKADYQSFFNSDNHSSN